MITNNIITSLTNQHIILKNVNTMTCVCQHKYRLIFIYKCQYKDKVYQSKSMLTYSCDIFKIIYWLIIKIIKLNWLSS